MIGADFAASAGCGEPDEPSELAGLAGCAEPAKPAECLACFPIRGGYAYLWTFYVLLVLLHFLGGYWTCLS